MNCSTAEIILFLAINWIVLNIGMLIGAWWQSRKPSDAEMRLIHHMKDEHSIDFPENSKIKSPDDWPRGGI